MDKKKSFRQKIRQIHIRENPWIQRLWLIHKHFRTFALGRPQSTHRLGQVLSHSRWHHELFLPHLCGQILFHSQWHHVTFFGTHQDDLYSFPGNQVTRFHSYSLPTFLLLSLLHTDRLASVTTVERPVTKRRIVISLLTPDSAPKFRREILDSEAK